MITGEESPDAGDFRVGETVKVRLEACVPERTLVLHFYNYQWHGLTRVMRIERLIDDR